LAFFGILVGVVYYNLLVDFHDRVQKIATVGSGIGAGSQVVQKYYGNLNFLFIFFIPLFTMHAFIEERKNSTYELIASSTITTGQYILSKFSAQLTFLFLLLLLALFPLSALWQLGHTEPMAFLRGHLSILLNGVCYIWLGLFCSAVFSSQVVAATGSLLGVFLLWLFSWFEHNTSNFLLAQIFSHLSLTKHFYNILIGTAFVSDFVFYLSFIAIGAFLTWHKIEYQEQGGMVSAH
jgi:ABC-2 type transport system permease protein